MLTPGPRTPGPLNCRECAGDESLNECISHYKLHPSNAFTRILDEAQSAVGPAVPPWCASVCVSRTAPRCRDAFASLDNNREPKELPEAAFRLKRSLARPSSACGLAVAPA
eukprot:3920022-Prymnesium_polylepis.1